jgi:hypothetical protein
MKNFLTKNLSILIFTAIAVGAVLNDWLFVHLGALLYIPAAAGVWSLVWRLIIQIRFRDTICADSRPADPDSTPRQIADWNALTPAERMLNTTLIKIGVGIALAIIAASVGK